MIDAEDLIPPEGILLLEAFEYFYRRSTPNWADLQYQLTPREKTGLDGNRAWDEFDRAQRVANQRFRKLLTGSLDTFVRDPRNGQNLKLPRDRWDEPGEFENGITANFVGPDDPLNRGPNTVVEGKRRPVFFIRSELEKLVEAEFGVPRRSGRPREHDWGEGKLFGEELLKTQGDPTRPENQVEGWRSQADLARAIMAHMAKHSTDGKEPPLSSAQNLAANLLKDFNR